jgi:hypothetical protein
MAHPVPFGKSTLNNSPLVADGSDFPCKQRPGVYDAEGANNIMVIGQPQPLNFIGSAVHGGGSCQISLTTDKAPTKNSHWQVILSIEGGCPSSPLKNQGGNFAANPNDATSADQFNFTIPADITPGTYTLAWTWFNRIGNREMYMNCAPVTVQAGASARKVRGVENRRSLNTTPAKRATFPAMFVANLASINSCGTTEGTDVTFPDPGAIVRQNSAGPFLPPTGSGCGVAAGNGATGGSGSSPAPAASSASSPTATAPASSGAPGIFFPSPNQSASPPSASSNPAAQAPVASPSSTPTASAPASSAPSSNQPSSSPPSSSPPTTPSPPSTGSSTGTLSGTCTQEGSWNCIAGSAFQRCASGSWSAVVQMAAGTKCASGVSTNFEIMHA